MQLSNKVFLVRPAAFGFNEQTALSNSFQQKSQQTATENQVKALEEFDHFVQRLKAYGINVLVLEDTPLPVKPDAIFPNNWVSVHADGTMVLYPMCTPNRRLERTKEHLQVLKEHCSIKRVLDYTHYEDRQSILEGTGSIVFDHNNSIAYACLSPRTNQQLFETLMKTLGYAAISFEAVNAEGIPIYHTNVMMGLGAGFVVICLDAIANLKQRKEVLTHLKASSLEIIEISLAQMNHFAGNVLALQSQTGQILVLSQSAFDVLTSSQKLQLAQYCELLPMAIPTIEKIGGGSARCMIGELFC